MLFASCLLLLWPLSGPARAARPNMFRAPPAVAAQSAIRSLPEEAQTELFTLYSRYTEVLAKRQEEGWLYGLLPDEIVETGDDNPQPARQIEAAIRKREAELKKLKLDLAKSPAEAAARRLRARRDAVTLELTALREADRRAKGTCLDWSDAIWAELNLLKPEGWTVHDQERQARPFHTGVLLCAPPEESTVCLVFDPWQRGQPDAYDYGSWDSGSFESRVPADFFLHELPEPRPARASRR